MIAILEYFKQRSEAVRNYAYVRKRFPACHVDPTVMFRGDLSNLHLDENVSIRGTALLHLGGLAWCDFAGSVEIGRDTYIATGCVLYGCGRGGIRLGRNVDCGPNVGIFASRTDYFSGPGTHVFGTVDIGDDVIIYTGAVIGPGVKIGHGAVIAANAVVTRDVPPNSLCGGVPAAVIRANIRATPGDVQVDREGGAV